MGGGTILRKSYYILGLLILMATLVLWGCGQSVMATVNGDQITAQELDQRVEIVKNEMMQQGFQFEGEQGAQIEQMLRRDLLNQMIDEKLVLQEAKKRNLLPSDKEVADEIKKIKEQLGDEGNFKKFLAANGVNEPKLNDLVKEQLALMKLQEQITADLAEPEEAEIKNYYNQHKDQFGSPEQRQVRHILIGTGNYSGDANRTDVEAKVLALQVVDKLKAGGDFGELAKQYSDDPGSKDNGGQYPPFGKGSGFAPEFEDAAFNLKEGALTTEPVKTDFGYHIIRLDKVVAAQTPSLEEARETIIATLQGEAANKALGEFVQSLRDQADLVNNLDKDIDKDTGANTNKSSTKS